MPESDFEASLYQLRREKREQIVALGQQAYPNSYACTHTVPEIRAAFDAATGEELEAARTTVSIAGRLMAIRVQGKAGFAQLQQGGRRLQIYVRKDDVGETLFALYKLLDLGDHVGVRGFLFRTRTGELTVHVAEVAGQPALTFLTKAMLALPDKYHGLEDTELRYRQRYVDLFMNTGHGPALPAGSSSTAPSSLTPGSSSIQMPSSRPEQRTDSSSVAERRDPRISSGSHTDLSETPSDERSPLDVREVFVKRAAVLRAIRKFFDARDYLEVETPMLHTIAGGAAARPFKTHHNALDIPLSLRIAPELYLKRLVVGGLDRVYEINRNFRNEGVSTRHNPEFTMLEFYQAYSNYHDLMQLTEELIASVATEVNGSTLCNFSGHMIDLGNWRKLTMREAIIKYWPKEYGPGPAFQDFLDGERFKELLINAMRGAHRSYMAGEEVDPESGRQSYSTTPAKLAEYAQWQSITKIEHAHVYGAELGKSIADLFELLAEPHLIQPTIIYDFPLAVSPLSKQKPDDPDWVERFEFYIGGFEVGNAFSELNDPDEQRRRFEDQLKERDRGDDEAHAMDEDYVRALGYGMPPTAGEGIGIDRLTMILTGAKSIRDVILFPLMRPQGKASSPAEKTDAAADATA